MRFNKKNLFWLAFISLLTMGIPAYAATSYTTADVAQHNTVGNCWVTVGSGVYDLTAIMIWHPGVITCGANMTALYLGKHTTLGNINPYYIGDLVAIVPPAPVVNTTNTTLPGTNTTNTTTPINTTIPTNNTGNTSVNTGNSTNPTNTSVPVANSTNTSLVQYAPSVVLAHNSSNDCWVSVFGRVYDVTPVMATYGYFYTCGIDNTQAWQASIFGNDTSIMNPFYLGDVIVTIPPVVPPAGQNTTANTTANTTIPTNTTTNTNTTLPQNNTIPGGNNGNNASNTSQNTTQSHPGSGNNTTNGNHSGPSRDDGDDEDDDDREDRDDDDRNDVKEERERERERAKQARESAKESEKRAKEQAKAAAERAREQAKNLAEKAREERKAADKARPSRHDREENDD